ncbi:MAG: ChbG/HpnK family deacetylase [Alicyclobacillus herbarius]|uniref:carbohydrate deacetylase n=1 Tax=Alicyclobacillus herbarius TaxID=122960 RepID=UPI002354097E|nr:ChbG/HpnK family deacetylase [Alicyclobacillus herbarius]MCL6632144.1 ChbG/HpnK family deacetylase [Alicyclobacillus herbarius]
MTLWRDMGLDGKRCILVHHDDLGVLAAQNQAYLELGWPTGSIMTPGAWAAQVKSGDLGVHLTLTSEWAYPRMRPLTGGQSLCDESGYFWSTLEAAWQHIRVEEAEMELRAQVEACRRLGIEPTHLDTHMGAVMRPDIATVYHQLGIELGIPIFLPENLEDLVLPEDLRVALTRLAETSPLPKVRLVDSYPVSPETRIAWYVDTLSHLGPGVYHLIHHAAVPTDEARLLPDWEKRAADWEALRHPEVRRVLGEFVHLTYRDLNLPMAKARGF